jgi:Binding-protein-dependent transport system inner membrane component
VWAAETDPVALNPITSSNFSSTRSFEHCDEIVYSPIFARIVRAPTLGVMQQQYVEGARAIGVGRGHLIARHVRPNIAAPVIVQTTLSFSTAILSEATLSFLGLGTQPPHPSWGTMLSAGRRSMELAPRVAVYPGLAVALTALRPDWHRVRPPARPARGTRGRVRRAIPAGDRSRRRSCRR